eukprot:TRINITY_DN2186_c0_g1_i1.p1 TRINITY_DN2186_c0_g1~~TRINITY_DN2186_c0_g1_i1.p1  ORF type:complete len:116 (+),score=35.17 TRINITY_DN2186_c0_g1_i1:582-929(+)
MFFQKNKEINMEKGDETQSSHENEIQVKVNSFDTDDIFTKSEGESLTFAHSIVDSKFGAANYEISDDFEDLISSFNFSSGDPFPQNQDTNVSDYGLAFDDEIYMNPFFNVEKEKK